MKCRRSTSFIDTLAQAADHWRKVFLREVQGPRESNEPGVYEWTLTMLRYFLNQAASKLERDPQKQLGSRYGGQGE